MKIAVIGAGNVGRVLGAGWAKAGSDREAIRVGGRRRESEL
jgi:predicted dinucleotide-binding enzyme